MNKTKTNQVKSDAIICPMCLDTEKDIWCAMVINWKSKKVVLRGEKQVGMNAAYESLANALKLQ